MKEPEALLPLLLPTPLPPPLPCPFCGSPATHLHESGRRLWWVECTSCDARGPLVIAASLYPRHGLPRQLQRTTIVEQSRSKAVAAWNNRK
jgi:Lar family restriction alleviation protein